MKNNAEELENKYRNIILKDDETETGGVSFHGETLYDFMLSCDIPLTADEDVINKALKECGIMPVDLKMSDLKHKIEKNIKEYEAACNVLTACANNAIKQIKDIVKTYKNSIDVSKISSDMGLSGVCLIYDGGNHPEYASNVFSEVERVYVREDRLFVETEDEDCEASDLPAMELMEILGWIYDNHKNGVIKEYYNKTA